MIGGDGRGQDMVGQGVAAAELPLESGHGDLIVAHHRQRTAVGYGVGPQMLPDERAVVVDIGVVAGIRSEAAEVVAARGNADDGRAGTQIHEQGSARVSVARIGIVARCANRILILPAHQLVSVLADIRAVNRLDGAPTFDAVVVAVATAAPEATISPEVPIWLLGLMSLSGIGSMPVTVSPSESTATSAFGNTYEGCELMLVTEKVPACWK